MLSFPCLGSMCVLPQPFGGLENLMSPLVSWHRLWVLLPPQAGQTQLNSQCLSDQPHHLHWHQALCVSWPLLSSSPACHFLEWLLSSSERSCCHPGKTSSREEGGREKRIRAKCRAHGPCRGCGVGCLEGSGASFLCCSGAGRGVWSPWTGCWGLPLRHGLRCWCRMVRICSAARKQQAQPGAVWGCAVQELLMASPACWLQSSTDTWHEGAGELGQLVHFSTGVPGPSYGQPEGETGPAAPLLPVHGTALGSAICVAVPSWCLNRSQGWWRQIKVFLCAVQNR